MPTPPYPPVDPVPGAYPYPAPPADPGSSPYGPSYGGAPDPFGPGTPYGPPSQSAPGQPIPPAQQPGYPGYPAYPPYPPAGQPQGSPYDPARSGYPSPYEPQPPYEQPPSYWGAPGYGQQHPFDPAPAAPAAMPARPNGTGGAGKRNGGSGAAATPRRRRRSNRGALIGVGAIGLALLIGLIAVAFALFDDDGGGDDDGGNAGAVATQTREAELAALAALTPTAEPTPTVEPEAEPTEPPAGTEATEEAAQEGGASGDEGVDGADEAAAADEPEPTAEEEEVTLESFLPGDGDVPDGFTLDSEDEFTEDFVASTFGDDAGEAAERLNEWGWEEGGIRTYVSDGEAEETTVLIGSAHHFNSTSDAKAALPYFSDAAASAGLEDIEVDRIGAETRALSGETAQGANQVVLYIRSGPYLLRVAGTSAEGDPTEAVIALAEQLVEG